MHKNIKILPPAMRDKLSDKQRRTVESYSSPVKLKAVLRWKQRLAAAGVKIKELAEHTNKVPFRISEWVNFTHEPSEENFNEIEAGIYELEK